jgi:VCBS repeat-containing protein
VKEAPVGAADSYTTNEDTRLTVAVANGVLKNDKDPDAGDTIHAVLATQAAHGTVVLNANGSFTYTPTANFNNSLNAVPGPDTFTYKAVDQGGLESGPITVSINVTPTPDASTGTPAIGGASTTLPNTPGLPNGSPGVILTGLRGTLADPDGIKAGSEVFTWEKSSNGLGTGAGAWAAVGVGQPTLTVPTAPFSGPQYYRVTDTYTDLAGGSTKVVGTTEALIGTSPAFGIFGGVDTLRDTVSNGTAVNLLAGLTGNDTYVITHGGVTILEAAAGGANDQVQTTLANYTLADNVETLSTGGAVVNTALIWTGNASANDITTGSGGDTLDGGKNTGAAGDVLRGGAGNDTYILRNAADSIVETQAGGNADQVTTALATYTLANNVENLTTLGTLSANLTWTGNNLANDITTGSGNDVIDGGRNAVGAGPDILRGGAGDDTYLVHQANDRIVDTQGTDTVKADITYSLAATNGGNVNAPTVENLTLVGTLAINGTGNALVNVITGNTGDNRLTGGAGGDTFVFGTAASKTFGHDTITDFQAGAAAGHDTIDLIALNLNLAGTNAAQWFNSFINAPATANVNVTNVGPNAHVTGQHAQIHIGTETIDLNVLKNALTVDDFKFH